MIASLFKYIFSGIEFFLKCCEALTSKAFLKHLTKKNEAFIKFTRLFEDIFREIVALIRNLNIFQRLRGFLKTFSLESRLF
jgi:hypothetical protein